MIERWWPFKPSISLQEEEIFELKKQFAAQGKELQQVKIDLEQYWKDIEKPNWKKKNILSALYTQSIARKADVIKTVQRYRENYLYVGILQLLIEDALSHNPVTNDLVQITSDNSVFNKHLQELQERVDIDGYVSSIVEDMLSLGEYMLSVECKPGEGVTKLRDDLDQSRLIAVYDYNLPAYFLELAEDRTFKGVTQIEPWKILHFCYGYSKLRMKIEGRTQSQYVRIGKPIMWGTFNLINYLDILTALVPAQYVQKLNSTSIIGVSVPEGMAPDEALKTAQRYEGLLNKFNETSDNEELTAQILKAIGKFKVIPVWGDRGQLNRMDPRWEEMTDVPVLEDIRRSIMASVGVPYNFIFGGEGDKNQTLKQFSRYLRKLALIQRAVKEGLTQLALIHLINVEEDPEKKLQPSIKDIQVRFTNQLISVEELDKLEFVDTLIAVVKNSVESINSIAASAGATINAPVLEDFLVKYLQMVGMENIFNLPEGVIDLNQQQGGQEMEGGEEEEGQGSVGGLLQLPEGAFENWSVTKLADYCVEAADAMGRAPVSEALNNIINSNKRRNRPLAAKVKQVFDAYKEMMDKKKGRNESLIDTVEQLESLLEKHSGKRDGKNENTPYIKTILRALKEANKNEHTTSE